MVLSSSIRPAERSPSPLVFWQPVPINVAANNGSMRSFRDIFIGWFLFAL
jgi:hypothetical protein